MAKFTTDYVNLIANNLRDRYKTGFPVLKELVQNADDAGATRLTFGFHPGLQGEADHELLAGPALWVLNNGRFTETDRRAIRSFGVNSKAAESGAIGKFGLGMKSVFHLCEAFFYVASDGQQGFDEILSPWFQDSGSDEMHQRWEIVTQRDLHQLNDVAAAHQQAQTLQSWFMLWVPLRRRCHVPQIVGQLTAPIIDRYPGDAAGKDLDFFTEPEIERRIGRLLPLLRNLQVVRFVGTDELSAFDVQIELQHDSRRLDHETDGLRSRGHVVDGGARSGRLHFVAAQTVLRGAQPFASLQAADGWPKSNAIVAEGRRAPVPDKAQPEGAVVMSHADKRRGHLRVQWAVFLPTEEGRYQYQASIPDSSREYSITLHGQFFVDAGRRGIDGMDRLGEPAAVAARQTTESAVQLAWNQAIAQELLLPRVLPTLAEYVDAEGLNDDQTTILTQALVDAAAVGESGTRVYFCQAFGAHLCRQHGWARTLSPDGPKWELVPSGNGKTLQLPRPVSNDPRRPWRALPGLRHLAPFTFIDRNAPRIMPAPRYWDEELVATALADLPIATLTGEVELSYLVDFLAMHQDRALNTARVQDQLVVQMRRILRDQTLSKFRAHRQLFKQLIGCLLPTRRFGLGTRDPEAKGSIPEPVYQQLLEANTQALLLPADLAPDGDDLGSPSNRDVEGWLLRLGELISRGNEIGRCLSAAEAFLKQVKDGQADMLRRHPELRILPAFDVRSEAEVAISLQELLDQHERSLVFRTTDPKNRLGLTRHLVQAVIGLHPSVIGSWVSSLLRQVNAQGSKDLPDASSATAMFDCIGSQPSAPGLGDPDARTELLGHVGSADLTRVAVCHGVRYLLHGGPSRFKSGGTLWKAPSGKDSPWVLLWRMVTDDSWSVLPNELSSQIPDKCSEALEIKAVEQATVTATLRQGGVFDAVDAAKFSATDLDLILGQIEDETSWRKLPLHRDRSGTFGPATGNCFRGLDPVLPKDIGRNLRFIVESNDAAHLGRQRNFITKWSAELAAEQVLQSDGAVKHWRYLMDILQQLPPSSRKTKNWTEVAWLPLASGGAISPASLIQLDGLEADISTLAVRCDFAFAGISELSDEIWTHPAFEHMKSLVPAGADALPALAMLMVEADMTVGSGLTSQPELLSPHQSLLCDLSALPAWRLLYNAAAVTSLSAVEAHLLNQISRRLTPDHAERVLEELSSKVLGPDALDIYFAYLRDWADSASAAELKRRLPLLKLPAADGSWRPAAELVCGAPGVEPARCAHPKLGAILRGIAATNEGLPCEPNASDAAILGSSHDDLTVKIERWCESFEQSNARQALGALIGLFGSEVKAIAERWIAPISYADYLLMLGWRDPGYETGPDRRRKWMGGHSSPEQPFALMKPVLIEHQASKVSVHSLTGGELQVQLASSDDMSTLLAGPLRWLGGYGVQVPMRPIACLLKFDLTRQKQILQQTAEKLLSSFYGQESPNLTGLWQLFDEADQVELDVARDLILYGLPQMLEQLSVAKKHPTIAAALRAVDKSRRDIYSAQRAKSDLDGPYDRFNEASAELRQLVGSDDSVQQVLLKAIRNKIASYHYERSSIPFEILQNADDAVGEYQEMQRAQGRSRFPQVQIGHFVVAKTERGVMLMHWGRPINYTGRHQGARDEYGKDLERMLMLGASAKEIEDGVTGKFGLGFKSVLLATDRPVVASGDLRFEIIAGCLPQRADLSLSARQRESLHQRTGLRPTVLELPIASDSDREAVMRRFSALAGLCAVFARQIRQIEVNGALHSWSQDRLLDAGRAWCELGQVQIPYKEGLVSTRLLVLRCDIGAMAIRIEGYAVRFDQRGSDQVPAIWVNQPTRGTPANGVILNAGFEIDTGRGSLPEGAASRGNLATARRLADSLAPVVSELVRQTRADWVGWSSRLAAAPQIDAAGYWHALWSVLFGAELAEDASQDSRLTHACVQQLFSRVLDGVGWVPNGMPESFAGFARLDALRLAVPCGRLRPVLPLLAAWPAFSDLYPSDSWCRDDVAAWLQQYKAADEEWYLAELERTTLFEIFGSERKLADIDIPHLAGVINAWPQGPTEDQGWRNELARVQLKSRSGGWKPAAALHFEDDLLAQFAPEDYLLDPAYATDAAAWRVVSRYLTTNHIQEQDLARWSLTASTEDSRRAAISWLAQNLDSGMVWYWLKQLAVRQNWIMSLQSGHALLADLPAEEQSLVLVRLGLSRQEGMAEDEVLSEPAIKIDIEVIHDWWLAHRQSHLPRYERALWPQHIDKSRLADDSIDREAWMTLFSLGVFRRFGRVRDEQNRGFLEFLHSRGWWSTISEVHPDEGSEQWMRILREYAETNQVSGEFEQWMDSFPRLYRLARWCDEYVELFRGLEFRDEDEARHLLTPAADSSLSGSGFDAPTIHRTLRIGHSLVIRELLRAGVLNSQVAQSMAFMPGSSVRDFLDRMGYTGLERSKDIHAMLVEQLGSAERASFGGDYDIPLILLANSDDLRREAEAWAVQQALMEDESEFVDEELS